MEDSIINYFKGLSGGFLYAFIFVATFLECSAFIGLVLPATIIVIFAGIMAQISDGVSPVLAFSAAFAGGYMGDLLGFYLGRRLKNPITRWIDKKWPQINTKEKLKMADDFLSVHGKWAIIIGQFYGPLRSLLPFSMGYLRFPSSLFYVLDFVGVFALVTVLFGAGWLMGSAFDSMRDQFFQYFYLVVMGIGLLFYFFFVHKYIKK